MLIASVSATGCSLVRTPIVDRPDTGDLPDIPGLDAPRPDVPGLDAPEPDVPGLDAPRLDTPPDVPAEPDGGCVASVSAETACDRIDEDCDGVVDDDDVCGCTAFSAAGRAWLSCPPASGRDAWSGECGARAPGYQLATFADDTEMAAVVDALMGVGVGDDHWVGLNDFDRSGEYVWFDRRGDIPTVPGDDPTKRCVQLKPARIYEELSCGDVRRVVCEAVVAPGACGAEASTCNGIDENCNGVPDDGLDCGERCRSFTFWDSAYYQCDAGADWGAASDLCLRATGGALAVFDGDVERRAAGMRSDAVWIGLRQSDGGLTVSGGWSWPGSTSTYAIPPTRPPWENGGGGEPDDGDDNEDDQQNCGAMRDMDDELEDRDCAMPLPFLCERAWSY